MSKIENYLTKCVDEGKIPGGDYLVMQDHKPLLRVTVGYADMEHTAPLPKDAAYYIYSCTKPVTAAAAMQLIENGKLSLDDKVSRYLPEFADCTARRDGTTVPAGDLLTVRHLLTMTGGFDYDLMRPNVRELIAENPEATTREIVRALAARPLCFLPGEQYQYSLCHDVLGAVIEEASGMRFGAYLEERLFRPLGMTHTHFAKNAEAEDDPRLLPLYCCDASFAITREAGNGYVPTSRYESGGAGLISTVEDYAKFTDAMACRGVGADGTRILKAETVDLLRTEQLSRIRPGGTAVFGGEPEIGYGYALGVRTLIEKKNGIRSHLGEFGWGGAAGGYLLIDPEVRLSIVYFQHVLNHTGKLDICTPLRDWTYEELGL